MYCNDGESGHSRIYSDQLLMGQACAGDESAFEVLVQRYQSVLHRFAQTRVGSEQAYDIVQFVWLQFYRYLPALQNSLTFSSKDLSLKHWLLRVARNRCIDEILRLKRHPQLFFSQVEGAEEEDGTSILMTFLDTSPLPEVCAIQKDGQEGLRKAIQLLPPLPRLVVWLRYTESLSFAAIGQRLCIPPTTAKAQYYRARPKLRTALERLGYSDAERERQMMSRPRKNIC
ncbi:MAG TPA: RNA polymerase sigma factor [Ktedonobacteraceae bacterium]